MASGTVPPDPSGPATHLAYVLPEIARRGHDLEVLAFGHSTSCHDGHATIIAPDRSLVVRQWQYARAYARDIRRADLVYVTSLGLPRYHAHPRTILRVPGDRAWERAVNRRWIRADETIDDFQHRRYGPLVEVLKAVRSREARAAAAVIVPSDYLRAMVAGWGVDPARIHVMPSCVGDVGPALDRQEARRRLGWPADARRLVTVARLTPWKGVDALIDVMADVPDVTLTVVGDGPERAALAARAAARGGAIEFTGTLAPADVRLRLAAADYLVLYSGYEGLSHAILEALHGGTPVIASRQGGNPELVRHGGNGWLVDYPDRDALRIALRSAFEPGIHERLVAACRDGMDAYAAGPVSRQLVDLLEDHAATGPH